MPPEPRQQPFEIRMAITPDLYVGNNTPSPEMVELAQTLSAELEKVPRELRRISRKLRRFEKRLGKRWRKPLSLLEAFVLLATGTGSSFYREHRDKAMASGDPVFEVMILSHARACQIASAILTLLKAGYADDAMARWRSLHEIWVTTSFIGTNDPAVAERYLQHLTVEQYKLAYQHENAAERLGDDPFPPVEFEELRDKRDRLVAKFGPEFGEDYGWAADALKNKRPTFSQIEAEVSLDHWRPYYGMASGNVHAAAYGSYFRLGSYAYPHTLLLSGPSDSGFADPGHCTAIALGAVTTNLLKTKPSLTGTMTSAVLHELQEEVGAAFLRAQRRLEVITSAYQTDNR